MFASSAHLKFATPAGLAGGVYRWVLALFLVFSWPDAGSAQTEGSTHTPPVPEVAAAHRATPIAVDGLLDEPAWADAPAATHFLQREPAEGEPATQRTEVRFLFDDEALYVGARMYDDLGGAGVTTRLVRRDANFESDFIEVSFDTYHDHLGSSVFAVNPSGVKSDALSGDYSWDPVWEAVARIDSLGWTAEMRIPYSQLRFPRSTHQTWGLQVHRRVTRINERSQWSFWGQNESGGPSRYGHLTGLELRSSLARLEILPYVVGQLDRRAGATGDNPFHRSTAHTYRTGVDLKYLLSSNLTLSATINPDFGQVEVDPAVVNLSAFETFFQERRPFFVEGSSYFGFSPFWCFFCSNASNLGLFYSRRIGRVPQGAGLAHSRALYADVPASTTILGAAKLTGRTQGGWSIAVLNAVAAPERAELIMPDGTGSRIAVEPTTNYFVSRIKRDMRGGNVVIGGIATSTLRALNDGDLSERLSRSAESVGFDTEMWWKDRTYHLLAAGALSRVAGDPAAILRLQESSARYFQRPDRGGGSNRFFSDAYDPARDELRGYGVYTRLAKDAGAWQWEAAVNARSPGFEVNDIAFLQRADYVWMSANVMRNWTDPTRWYRRLSILAGAQQQYNYDGDRTDLQSRVSVYTQLPNYWDLGMFVIDRPSFYDDRLTRGGPMALRRGFRYIQTNLATDSRRTLSLATNPSVAASPFGHDLGLNLNIRYRPASNVSLALGPRYDRLATGYQYVTSRADPVATAFYGQRYVFADLDQRTIAMDTRLNVTFSPTLSLEVFAQPFISSGSYSNFKEFDAPRSLPMSSYGTDIGTIATRTTPTGREYLVDPDGSGPAAGFTFGDPNFNVRSLRGNAVLRWEYRPGSTLFLVWGQDRRDTDTLGDLRFDRDSRALFGADPNNVFLIKVNYWFNR